MYNHAPKDYLCPFCLLVQGIVNEHNWIRGSDLVFQNEAVTTFVALRRWPKNPGHVLVIPNAHYENIYDLPAELSMEIQKTAREVALAMKVVTACEGILLLQRNEAAAGQRAWHYHLHVIPRYQDDHLLNAEREHFPAKARAAYAQKLRTVIST